MSNRLNCNSLRFFIRRKNVTTHPVCSIGQSGAGVSCRGRPRPGMAAVEPTGTYLWRPPAGDTGAAHG